MATVLATLAAMRIGVYVVSIRFCTTAFSITGCAIAVQFRVFGSASMSTAIVRASQVSFVILATPNSELGPLDECENDELFARQSTDVVMKTQNVDASHIFDHGFHEWPRGFDQVRSHLLE